MVHLGRSIEYDAAFITWHHWLFGRRCHSICHVKNLGREHVLCIESLLLHLHLHEASLAQFTVCVQPLPGRPVIQVECPYAVTCVSSGNANTHSIATSPLFLLLV